MATIDYPPSLPDFRLGKQRQEVQTFRTSQPFNGPLFIEKITDESPVVWDVTITCKTQAQARGFQAFLRQIKNGTPFNKDILIEEGFSTHEVRFIEEPLAPRQLSPHVWIYTGVIYAVKLIQPDALVDDNLIILYASQSNIIDTAVNIFWPEFIPVVNPFARLANPLVHLFTNDKTVEKLTNGTLTTDRATTGTRVNKATGIVETIAIDTIREELEGFLIEGASTNLLLRSEEFDVAPWTTVGSSISPDDITAPDGNVTADKLIEDSSIASSHDVRQVFAFVSGNDYTASFFIKPAGRTRIKIKAGNTVTWAADAVFDLSIGTVVSTPLGTATITPAANGFFRCTVKGAALATANTNVVVFLVDSGTNTTYDGDGVSGVHLFGAQLEQLPFASSYIPTTTTAVTRAADDVSILFAGNMDPQLFSVMATVDVLGKLVTQRVFTATGGASPRPLAQIASATKYSVNGDTGSDNTPVVILTDPNKLAFTFDGATAISYANSLTDGGSSMTVSTSDQTTIDIGSSTGAFHLFGHMSDFMIYDFELTQTEIDLLQG